MPATSVKTLKTIKKYNLKHVINTFLALNMMTNQISYPCAISFMQYIKCL